MVYSNRRKIAPRTVVIMTPNVLMLVFDAAALNGIMVAPVSAAGKILLAVVSRPLLVALRPLTVELSLETLELLLETLELLLETMELALETLELPVLEATETLIGKPFCPHFVTKSEKKERGQTTKFRSI